MSLFVGLRSIATNIFCTVYVFGGWRDSPKWLIYTAAALNIVFFIGAMGLAMDM